MSERQVFFILVGCKFDLKNVEPPLAVFRDLAEIGYYLRTVDAYYCIGYDMDGFYLSYRDSRFDLEYDLTELLEANKLGYRHLRAYFWLKRHTNYEGFSHNPWDWEMHPDDFFKEVEEIIRCFSKERKGQVYE